MNEGQLNKDNNALNEDLSNWKKELEKKLLINSSKKEEICLISSFWLDNYENSLLNKNNNKEENLFNSEDIKDMNNDLFSSFSDKTKKIEEFPEIFALSKNCWEKIKNENKELNVIIDMGYFGNKVLIIKILPEIYCFFVMDSKNQIRQGYIQIIKVDIEKDIMYFFWKNGLFALINKEQKENVLNDMTDDKLEFTNKYFKIFIFEHFDKKEENKEQNDLKENLKKRNEAINLKKSQIVDESDKFNYILGNEVISLSKSVNINCNQIMGNIVKCSIMDFSNALKKDEDNNKNKAKKDIKVKRVEGENKVISIEINAGSEKDLKSKTVILRGRNQQYQQNVQGYNDFYQQNNNFKQQNFQGNYNNFNQQNYQGNYNNFNQQNYQGNYNNFYQQNNNFNQQNCQGNYNNFNQQNCQRNYNNFNQQNYQGNNNNFNQKNVQGNNNNFNQKNVQGNNNNVNNNSPFLQPEPIKKQATPGLIGLQNIGATCYMNATLQCFSHNTGLRNYLLKDDKYQSLKFNKDKCKLSFALAEVLYNLWKVLDHDYYEPEHFKKMIGEMNPIFKGIAANDPKDLIFFLLETMHGELNKPPNKNINSNNFVDNQNFSAVFQDFLVNFTNENRSIICDLFYGLTNSMTICGMCRTIIHNVQAINIFFFPLEEVRKFMNYQNNFVNIEDCFRYNEKQDFYPSFYCNKCRQLCPAYNQSKIIYSPPNLIVNLNRGKGLQFNIKIGFKEYLEIRNYVYANDSPHLYELTGVICHIGSNDMGGHFIAFCKNYINNNSQWYKYNDGMVTPSSFQEASNFGMHYVLFYSKIK